MVPSTSICTTKSMCCLAGFWFFWFPRIPWLCSTLGCISWFKASSLLAFKVWSKSELLKVEFFLGFPGASSLIILWSDGLSLKNHSSSCWTSKSSAMVMDLLFQAMVHFKEIVAMVAAWANTLHEGAWIVYDAWNCDNHNLVSTQCCNAEDAMWN